MADDSNIFAKVFTYLIVGGTVFGLGAVGNHIYKLHQEKKDSQVQPGYVNPKDIKIEQADLDGKQGLETYVVIGDTAYRSIFEDSQIKSKEFIVNKK